MPKLSRFARPLFLSISAATFVAIVIVGTPILLPFLLAVVVAYVLFPAVRLLERTRMPRWVAILLVYAVTLGSITAFGWATIPRFFAETKQLSAELPRLMQRARDEWLPSVDRKLGQWSGVDLVGAETPAEGPEEPEPPADPPVVIRPTDDGAFEVHLQKDLRFAQNRDGSWSIQRERPEPAGFSSAQALRDAIDRGIGYARTNSGELLKFARGVIAGLSRGVFYLFITLMLAGYMMYTYERIVGTVRQLWPERRRPSFDRFLLRVDRGLAGVVRGQLLICLVNGVLSAIGFWLFDLKYWPILSLIAAVMSIIPIFGSILSSIPAVAIGLTQGVGTAAGVLIWIVGIHQLEANFLNPKIIGDAAKIHPVLVVFALLLGEHFFQIPGALLAVPCLALVQAVFVHFRESILGIPGPYLAQHGAVATAAGGAEAPSGAAVSVADVIAVTGSARARDAPSVDVAEPADPTLTSETDSTEEDTPADPMPAEAEGADVATVSVRYSVEAPDSAPSGGDAADSEPRSDR
ncbi:MAG: AI-2E family transporter [Deltaproteobacteria bacterium]|jgi:predicted PurR-regulated permease PerM|nr:AI-2E family transporter [Deltaproteobacteria bacterium]MBW2534742.1 AI-2E family transporter [Deltaproteobacteria bacterium]